ncbi:hypothetical protein [Mycolicibacterium sp.]|uniref:hypothetical protein n=1 Tax=Mycolicibacterium sp. TaxID=2320850 RepID=UPI0037C567D1
MNRTTLAAAGAVAATLAGITGCGDSEYRDPAGTSESATSSSAPMTPSQAASAVDRELCVGPNGLQDKGDGFYRTFRHVMLASGSEMSISPLTLSGQLRTLASVGTSTRDEDGLDVINTASVDVRLAFSKMVRDADRLALHYTDIANGKPVSGPDRELTPLVNSFTSALIACAEQGVGPSWFDPKELTGH